MSQRNVNIHVLKKDKDIKNELDHGRNLNKNFTTGKIQKIKNF